MLKVVEVARKAVKTGDFNILKSNLEVLNEFLNDPNHKNSLHADDIIEINATINKIRSMINKEKNRRMEISAASKSYDDAKEKIDKLNELFDFYSDDLNEPGAKEYTYSNSPSLLKDFLEAAQKDLGLANPPTSLAEVEAERAKLEKIIDEAAFKINKLNGVYDEKVATQDLARATEIEKEKNDIKQRNNLVKKLEGMVSQDEYQKYTDGKSKKNISEIDSKISALEKKPVKKRTEQDKQLLDLLKQLKTLPTQKRLANAKEAELKSIYSKYGVSSIEDLNTVLSNKEIENTPEQENDSKFLTSNMLDRIDNSSVTAKEGIRVIKKLSTNLVGKNLEEATINLRQEGYMPCVGKESVIYARPVFKRPILGRFGKPKLKGMELVEESIESLTKSPEEMYSKALKDLQMRSKLLENGPQITDTDISNMKKAFSQLIKDSRYDEAIKRIISAQVTMTRADLANFVGPHLGTYDALGKCSTVNFPGGEENYKAPHIPVKTKFFGLLRVPQQPDPNAPNDAVIPTQENTQYLRNVNTAKPVVSRHALRDRTHYKDVEKTDDHDER